MVEISETELEKLIRSHKRYERVRILNPNSFTFIWKYTINSGIPFDDYIDELIEKEKNEMA